MFEALLARLALALDGGDIPYMVISGQAVLVHGEPRLTRDIDLTLGVTPDRLSDVLAVIEELGLRPLVDPSPFVSETLVLPCEDDASGIRVDLARTLATSARPSSAPTTCRSAVRPSGSRPWRTW
ncbi:MAG: nucleotidyl transferase AbiEii/AbiGii toxin family protein [Bacteroidota bacterium]